MGSIANLVTCPRCGEDECFDEYFYKTGEGEMFCPSCGYTHSVFIKRDENGNFVKKDDGKDLNFDNLIFDEILIDNPYGAYEIKSSSTGIQMGVLRTEDHYRELASKVKTSQEDGLEHVVVSRFVDGQIQKEILFQFVEPGHSDTKI